MLQGEKDLTVHLANVKLLYKLAPPRARDSIEGFMSVDNLSLTSDASVLSLNNESAQPGDAGADATSDGSTTNSGPTKKKDGVDLVRPSSSAVHESSSLQKIVPEKDGTALKHVSSLQILDSLTDIAHQQQKKDKPMTTNMIIENGQKSMVSHRM